MKRSIRVPEDLWYAALNAAQDRGETLNAVIRRALAQYVARHERRKAKIKKP